MFWVQHHSFTRSLAAWMFFSFVPVHWSLWSLGVVLGHFLVVFVSCMDRGHTRHDAAFFFSSSFSISHEILQLCPFHDVGRSKCWGERCMHGVGDSV